MVAGFFNRGLYKRTGNADGYLRSVLEKHQYKPRYSAPTYLAKQHLMPELKEWSPLYFSDLLSVGAFAKGTSIVGGGEADLLVMMAPNCPHTPRQIHSSLMDFLKFVGYSPRVKHVGINIMLPYGLSLDLIPAVPCVGVISPDYKLYDAPMDLNVVTNFDKQLEYVKGAYCTQEIKALKIWRTLHKLDFPSYYLELAVIDALSLTRHKTLSKNILHILAHLANHITTNTYKDKANPNNRVSDEVSAPDKKFIADIARLSISQVYWNDILW